jgi:hypothetical protein
MRRLIRIPLVLVAAVFLSVSLAVSLTVDDAWAACTVEVINQTGYDLQPLKFVQEVGGNKKVLGQVPMRNGGSHTFKLGGGGQYRVYGLLTKDGEKKYAKGNLYTLNNGSLYSLTLKKVVFSGEGNSVSFISKDEFDKLN